jgi:hypothetical protein|tara:strand:- start:38 stop:967 length:930 start_codon:yes stop_codon:yes gene_type:complete
MKYTPKSKYQQLQSSGDKYIDPRNNQPYIGPYILTSEGAFIRKANSNNSIKLLLKNSTPFRNNLFPTEKAAQYTPLNESTSNFVKFTFPIISTKIKPTEKDYERGYYTRYFCKRNNAENVYYEIDKTTHNALKTNNKSYDYSLYTADSLIWAIDGDIIKANNITLKLKSKSFPNIASLFVKLNEYQKVRTAKKGELIYEDGTEYLGFYHIHLGKPMEGLFHPQKPHKNLLFVDKNTLYKKDPNLESFIYIHGDYDSDYNNTTPSTYIAPQQVQEQTTQVLSQPSQTSSPSYTPPTPSTGGGSSGGGGGY